MSDYNRHLATIEALEINRIEAMLGGDLETLDRLLHPDLVYSHSTGLTDDKAAYLEKLRSGTVRYIDSSWQILRITMLGDTVLSRVHLKMLAELNGASRPLNNVILSVWTQQSDYWRMIAHHPTPVAFDPVRSED